MSAQPPATSIGARKDGIFKAVSTAPSVNFTPVGASMLPLPYPTVMALSNSVGVASRVLFNGSPAYTLSSSQPSCTGDERGSGGGVKSASVNGPVTPTGSSRTVHAQRACVVRHGDSCAMNGGNNPGIYVTVPPPTNSTPSNAVATSNPPVRPETRAETSTLRRWLHHTAENISAAANSPFEASKGALKGFLNFPSTLAEALLKASIEQRAAEMDEAATTMEFFEQNGAAHTVRSTAESTRQDMSTREVPQFTMNNAAQEGGDAISTAVQLFLGGLGAAKAASKSLVKLTSRTGLIDAAVAKPVVKADSNSITQLINNGVRITGRLKKPNLDYRALRLKYADDIATARTFKTSGMKDSDIDKFLETKEGRQFLDEMKAADPAADTQTIYSRAEEQLASGREAPKMVEISSPVIKIVPKGEKVSEFSPYFTTEAGLKNAADSGKDLSEVFGLPFKSEAGLYDVYQIEPKIPAKVFINKVAPTSELNGLVTHAGGAEQLIIPNRSNWSSPELIGQIANIAR